MVLFLITKMAVNTPTENNSIYLELKISSIQATNNRTQVNYSFYTGEFTGLGDHQFDRSSVEHYNAGLDGQRTLDEVVKKLLPILYKEARKKGYKTFQ